MKNIARFFFGLIVLITLISTIYILTAPAEHTYETRTLVNKSPEECYSIFSDWEQLPNWMDDLSDVKLTKGKALEIGSEYELTFSAEDSEVKMKETIKSIRPNEEFAFDYVNDFMSGTETILFVKTENGTEIRTKNEFKGGNKIKDAMLKLVNSNLQEASQKTYSKLGKLIEKES